MDKSRHIKRIRGITVVIVLIMLLPLISGKEVYAKAKLSSTKNTVYVNNSITLSMQGTSKKVTWSSSNKKVATVNSSGKVTGKKAGTVKIYAKVSGKTYTCKVTVKKNTYSIGKYRSYIESMIKNKTKVTVSYSLPGYINKKKAYTVRMSSIVKKSGLKNQLYYYDLDKDGVKECILVCNGYVHIFSQYNKKVKHIVSIDTDNNGLNDISYNKTYSKFVIDAYIGGRTDVIAIFNFNSGKVKMDYHIRSEPFDVYDSDGEVYYKYFVNNSTKGIYKKDYLSKYYNKYIKNNVSIVY